MNGARSRALSLALVLAAPSQIAGAQSVDPPPPPSLRTVPVPEPANLYDFVADKAAAIRLGKALFWDMQLGSDGMTACATCHFNAGADSRTRNQRSPGLLARDATGAPAPDHVFDRGPNAPLSALDFPLRQLADPADRGSAPVRDSNDVVASQGVFANTFLSVIPGQGPEVMQSVPDPDGFRVGSLNVRRVEPRHSPSVINAVFNYRNFWDGRAQNAFNGVNEWGDRDPSARLYRATKVPALPPGTKPVPGAPTPGSDDLSPVAVRLQNASLASQAVAPVVSTTEMSADGRDVRDVAHKLAATLGRKLGQAVPLAHQAVHPQDSVLGDLSNWPKPGLHVPSYATLIQQAFRPEWRESPLALHVADDGSVTVIKPGKQPSPGDYSLLEYNFSLFLGLAIQLYEATLVSDDTPYDRWREGRGTLPDDVLLGLQVFLGQDARTLPDGTRRAGARCINCHAGPEFTDASVQAIVTKGVTRLRNGQDIDRGFNNIGVRPTAEDVGVGGNDAFGVALSLTRLLPRSGRFIATDGAFKAPGLRNVELTPPYFHNGGYATLDGVVSFYSRGGDYPALSSLDGQFIDGLSVPAMSATEQSAVVAFLRSLTDERVRMQSAPFDHPQLFVPNGQVLDDTRAVADALHPGQALDWILVIPAVGRNGGAPLAAFLETP